MVNLHNPMDGNPVEGTTHSSGGRSLRREISRKANHTIPKEEKNMKKTLKKVLALGAAAVMTIGCFSFTAMAEEAKDYTIAVVVKGNTNGWFVRMEEGIKRYAEETGINAYMTGPSDTDSAQQIQILQDVVSQNPDAICVFS